MKNTKIEWAHHSVNFWWGCMKVSAACLHCYAELLAKLFSRGKATWGTTGARWIRHEAARRELYALDKSAFERGVRERVFINSMSDTFEDRADLNEARGFLWDACNFVTNLDILLLTKRPENVRAMVPMMWLVKWPAHVWIGTTVENQAAADARICHLIEVPAKVRFLSCEPLLEGIDINDYLDPIDGGYVGRSFIDWVICGGESGGGARPMQHGWAAGLRDQCAEAGVPFFFKQWGEFLPLPGNVPGVLTTVTVAGRERRWVRNGDEIAVRVGKKEAGRRLDGIEHNSVPEVRT